MSTPFVAEIRTFSFGFPPKGWAQCNGQLLPIQQNAALFSLLGTTYGGDGQTTFGLPNLQGRVAVNYGQDPVSGVNYTLGLTGGTATVSLTGAQTPAHTHAAFGSTAAATSNAPGTTLLPGTFANAPGYVTGSPALTPFSGAAISQAGGGATHPNVQPFLTLNICIALTGIYPSRS